MKPQLTLQTPLELPYEEISNVDSKDIDRKMVLILIAQQKLILRQKFSLITGVGKGFLFI